DIKDDAVVCKHCHRELFVIKPLLQKIDALSARVAQLEREAGGPKTFVEMPQPPQPETRAETSVVPERNYISIRPGKIFVLCYLTLVAAHYFIILHYDLKLIYMKFASIAVPFLFGLLCRENQSRNLRTELVLGLSIAVAAILTMLLMTSWIDKVPF